MIHCKKGEFTHVPSGIWVVDYGVMVKVGTNSTGEYVHVNLCVSGDYVMPEADMKMHALTAAGMSAVSISDIDVVKVLHQINDLERLAVIRGHALNPPVPGSGIYQGRIAKFLCWISARTGMNDKEMFATFTQSMIGSFLGVKRCAISTRLSAMGYSSSVKKNT